MVTFCVYTSAVSVMHLVIDVSNFVVYKNYVIIYLLYVQAQFGRLSLSSWTKRIDGSVEDWNFSTVSLCLTLTVVYSDDAVEKLLDRTQEGEVEKEKEKEFGMNEYLRSFKVASYQVKEGVDEVR